MKFLPIVLLCASVFAQQPLVLHYTPDAVSHDAESERELTSWISANPTALIYRIRAFADTTQSRPYNRRLTENRIRTFVTRIESSSIQVSDSLQTESMGEEYSATKDRQDRRIEVYYTIRKVNTPSAAIALTAEKTSVPPVILTPDDFRQDDLSNAVKAAFETAKPGDKIRLYNIYFYLNKDVITESSRPVLHALAATLEKYPAMKIEIHGHMCCNANTKDTSLSDKRARKIYQFLVKKGISRGRLAFRSFGSAFPIFPIPEQSYEQERANQRVELLIVEN
mgnify:CR=1 FL=1